MFYDYAAPSVIYTEEIVGSVRCVEETDIERWPTTACGGSACIDWNTAIDHSRRADIIVGRGHASGILEVVIYPIARARNDAVDGQPRRAGIGPV